MCENVWGEGEGLQGEYDRPEDGTQGRENAWGEGEGLQARKNSTGENTLSGENVL